ncbi:hypothetical protein BZB76_1330 [Actinomadura pelletieri DSM 43383]|uniref:Uncharacterized protein n=1 Tax=Actinomadura pelletieri DSM 43383 TaxID=1120940 RepID=A0A495R066_9ACTN|nr:hypothetical protein [Actinomadura pelletieri]RKS79851.1 hypothetical protein BZB76_1330 [Actinomadura pelletieri DSM 43383]
MTQSSPEDGTGPKVTQGQSGASGAGLGKIQDLCRAVLLRRRVHHVAYYVFGNQLFWQDTFESTDVPGFTSPEEIKRKRETLDVYGQQLHYIVARLDRAFTPVRNGRLIRCVFDVGDGALFYYSPFPGEYLVGASLADTPVDEADTAMGELCEQVRLARGYGGTPNPGGFMTEFDVEVDSDELVDTAEFIHEDSTENHRPELVGHFRAALSPEALHYVAYFEGPFLRLSADLLRHPRLAPLTLVTKHADRRKQYERIGKLTYITVQRLDRTLLPLLGGGLNRVVLDVEAGALFYHRLKNDAVLVGVTLDQAKVAVAETMLNTLANAIAD